jgi:hypothetical protein
VTAIRIVLDTSAILEYTAGSIHVGEVIAEVADESARFAVPLLCLVEAARRAAAEHLPALYVLEAHEHGMILTEQSSDWRGLAGLARVLGRSDLAVALLTAQTEGAYILTAEATAYGDPGSDITIPI